MAQTMSALDMVDTIDAQTIIKQRPSRKLKSSLSNFSFIPMTDSMESADEISLDAELDGVAVSLEYYWKHIYGKTEKPYEWNNGIIEEKPTVADLRKFLMYMWFIDILRDFLYVNPIAVVIGNDMGFQFTTQRGIRVRMPDFGVILNTNPVPLGDWERSYRGIFDICIESVSDSKRSHVTRDTETKRIEYAQGGVPEYFILDESPPSRTNETAFYHLGPNGIYQPIQPINGVIRSSILQGFQLRREHLFSRPHPAELIDDPVYQAFISPHVRSERNRVLSELRRANAERLRAEVAEQQVETEHQRAEAEHQRAEAERQRAEEAERRLAEEAEARRLLEEQLRQLQG
ncbi:MAG: Uma2 family endonuclease [Chloroflexota bacterium]